MSIFTYYYNMRKSTCFNHFILKKIVLSNPLHIFIAINRVEKTI